MTSLHRVQVLVEKLRRRQQQRTPSAGTLTQPDPFHGLASAAAGVLDPGDEASSETHLSGQVLGGIGEVRRTVAPLHATTLSSAEGGREHSQHLSGHEVGVPVRFIRPRELVIDTRGELVPHPAAHLDGVPVVLDIKSEQRGLFDGGVAKDVMPNRIHHGKVLADRWSFEHRVEDRAGALTRADETQSGRGRRFLPEGAEHGADDGGRV